MAETAEVPEAKDPFEKRIAITIAVLAAILSFVNLKGDNAKTESILKTNEATNKWAYYQSKSIKLIVVNEEVDLLEALSKSNPSLAADTAEKREKLKKECERYEVEKEKIKQDAEHLEEEAKEFGAINDRCDQGALFLQLAVVIASVAILTHWNLFRIISTFLGLIGALIGLSSYFQFKQPILEMIQHLLR